MLGIEFLKLFNVDHDLQCPSQFDPKALDEGLVGEEEEGGPIDLLVMEHGSIVLAVSRALEKLDNLCDSPGTHVNWQAWRGLRNYVP